MIPISQLYRLYFQIMNNKYSNKAHDHAFKSFFSVKEIAGSFIQENFPPKLVKELDLNSLTIQKDSFIDKKFSEHFSDVLYQIKIKNSHSFIYFLFEHKSYNDRMTGFQLLRNMVKIWELYLKQKPNALELPVITPVVIYHGEKHWSRKNSFHHLFKNSEITEKYIPQFEYELYDLSDIPDENIKGILPLKIQMLLHKYIRSPKLIERFPQIAEKIDILQQQGGKDYLELIIRYLATSVDIKQMTPIKQILKEKIRESDKYMETLADKWFQDGVEKGIKTGIEKGIEKGIKTEKIEIAQKMISKGMSTADICELTGLASEQIETIRKSLQNGDSKG